MSDFLADRYGHGRGRRWPLVVIAVIVVAAAAWLVWAVWAQSSPKVTSSAVAYDVVDAHHARATVEVHLSSADVDATCLIRASAADHTIVGELHFRVPRGQGTDLKLTRTMRTERQATTVESQGCTAPGQKRPR